MILGGQGTGTGTAPGGRGGLREGGKGLGGLVLPPNGGSCHSFKIGKGSKLGGGRRGSRWTTVGGGEGPELSPCVFVLEWTPCSPQAGRQ